MRTVCLSFLFFVLLMSYGCDHYQGDENNTIAKQLTKLDTREERFQMIEDSIQKFGKNDKTFLKYLSLKSGYLNIYKEYDSALYIAQKQLSLAKKNKDTLRLIEAYYKKGLYSRKLKNTAEAIFYFDSCLSDSKKINNLIYEAKANTNLGSIYKRKDSVEKSFYHYNEAFNNYKTLKDSSQVAGKLLQMANIQRGIGDFLGSLETAVEGCKYADKVLNSRTLFGLYQNIAIAYRELGNYKNALEYSDKALAILNDSKVKKKILKSSILICKNTRANLFADQGNYQQAIDLYEEVLRDSSLSKKERNRSLDNLGYTLWLQDDQDQEALKILMEVMNSRRNQKDFKGLIASNIHLTKYFARSDKDRALIYANAALEYAKKVKSLDAQEEALSYILDLKENPSQEGKEYKKITSRLEKLQRDTRDIYVGTRFQNDQLKDQNYALEITNANQQNKIIFYIAILSILSIASIFIFFYLKAKYKRDKIKTIIYQTHRTEAQISKKVHDELANDMANTLQFIEQHPKILETTKTLLSTKLDNLYERTRDIATEISSFDISNFTQSLRSLIIQYHIPGVKVLTNVGAGINMDSLPDHKKTNVYRCVQELLINMKKHSEASEVRVIFKKKKNNFFIHYADNGKGVNLKNLKKRGLQNMESRIADIGGTITFISSIGKGFNAILRFKS